MCELIEDDDGGLGRGGRGVVSGFRMWAREKRERGKRRSLTKSGINVKTIKI